MDKAFIVLGGGVSPDGSLPQYVRARNDVVLERAGADADIIFSTLYSLNLPPRISNFGFPVSESQSLLKDYVARGGLSKKLYLENASFDTIGNSAFCALHFGWLLRGKLVCVVTSDFHIQRAEAVFSKVFQIFGLASLLDLEFLSAASDGDLSLRAAHEASQLTAFQELVPFISSKHAFLRWLFTEHSLYNSDFSSNFSGDWESFLY